MLRIYIRKFESRVHLLQRHGYRWRPFKRAHKELVGKTYPEEITIVWNAKLKLLVAAAACTTILFGAGIVYITWFVKGGRTGLIMLALFIVTAPALFVDALGLGLLLSFPFRRTSQWLQKRKLSEKQ